MGLEICFRCCLFVSVLVVFSIGFATFSKVVVLLQRNCVFASKNVGPASEMMVFV